MIILENTFVAINVSKMITSNKNIFVVSKSEGPSNTKSSVFLSFFY